MWRTLSYKTDLHPDQKGVGPPARWRPIRLDRIWLEAKSIRIGRGRSGSDFDCKRPDLAVFRIDIDGWRFGSGNVGIHPDRLFRYMKLIRKTADTSGRRRIGLCQSWNWSRKTRRKQLCDKEEFLIDPIRNAWTQQLLDGMCSSFLNPATQKHNSVEHSFLMTTRKQAWSSAARINHTKLAKILEIELEWFGQEWSMPHQNGLVLDCSKEAISDQTTNHSWPY